MIQAQIERLQWSEPISIAQGLARFFNEAALAQLENEFGKDNVKLVYSKPRWKVTILGADVAKAEETVETLIKTASSSSPSIIAFQERGQAVICPSCTDAVILPVSLGCGHTYRTGCLRLYLASAASREEFPLACSGNDDRCKVSIPIPIIREFLSSSNTVICSRSHSRLISPSIRRNSATAQLLIVPTSISCPSLQHPIPSGVLTASSSFVLAVAGSHMNRALSAATVTFIDGSRTTWAWSNGHGKITRRDVLPVCDSSRNRRDATMWNVPSARPISAGAAWRFIRGKQSTLT